MQKKIQHEDYTLDTQVQQHTTAIQLMQQSLEYMKQGIDDIRSDIKDLKHEITDSFVTKDQFAPYKKDIEELKRLKEWAIKLVAGVIIMGLLALLGLKNL